MLPDVYFRGHFFYNFTVFEHKSLIFHVEAGVSADGCRPYSDGVIPHTFLK